jgi:hypothetical protein
MSYNNGLTSAMTQEELEDAVRWSITNPWQSGVKDIFGSYTPIVRPQEMMTTPGALSIYKKFGIQAVSLYYSATPFDTFRVFSRPLSRLQSHNPILYRHPETGEEMVIIPTYHIGDMVKHVSLGNCLDTLLIMGSDRGEKTGGGRFIKIPTPSEFEKPVGIVYASIVPFLLMLLAAVLLTTYLPVLSTGLITILGK